MKHRQWTTMVGLIVGAAVVAAACGGSDGSGSDRAGGQGATAPVVLRMAEVSHVGPQRQLASFAEAVSRSSAGTLKIEFDDGWRLGEAKFEAGTIEDVQAGKIDMAGVGARVFDTVGVHDFEALVAPLLVDSHDLQGAVFQAAIPAKMLEGVDEFGLVGIGVLPGPMRKMLGVSKPYVRGADFAGAVVGIQDSAVAKQTFSALGATAKPVPTSAALDGLDAYEQQLDSIVGNHYSVDAGYVTGNINLWPRPIVIFMNYAAFDALTADQQATLKEAAADTVDQALDDSRTGDAESARLLCDEGMMLVAATDSELDELRTTLQPVYADLAGDPATKAYLDAISALKRELAAPPDAAECPTTNTSTVANLDGTYAQTLTGADILASGCDAPAFDGVEPELESYTELRLHDGLAEHYSRTNGGPLERGFIGTYSVFRDQMQIDESGGASFSVHWEFDGNRLVLSDLEFSHVVGEGCDHVVAWTTKPWVLRDSASTTTPPTPGDD